jgi:6-phospho-beta-glucosidase
MKIAVLGAGGVRTPMLVAAMAERRASLGLTELALMDIDAERLASIAALLGETTRGFDVDVTTDSRAALSRADFVITTFRVGGLRARIADERIPLRHGVLGQETTGPGGFAMALRSIPVLLGYIGQMRELCPDAWLVNFANPAGLLAQAAVDAGGWSKTVGICDAPSAMQRVAAAVMNVQPDALDLDYFGLNHLGWLRAVRHAGVDHLPRLIAMLRSLGGMPGLPFAPDFVAGLGMIPNEYLYYYYFARTAVDNLRKAPQTRGEVIAALNDKLFADLASLRRRNDLAGMRQAHARYLDRRHETYMANETGGQGHLHGLDAAVLPALMGQGYAGVALDLIEALAGRGARQMILNVPNAGAIHGMAEGDVVETSAYVSRGAVRPLATGAVPPHCLGLMQQVKAYERLTVEAAVEGAYAKALLALTVHPLVQDRNVAQAILDDYHVAHAGLWPELQ